MNYRYPVLVVLLHLCHQVVHVSEQGPVIFHPLFLGIRSGCQGSVAVYLFMRHELSEGQGRSRMGKVFWSGGAEGYLPIWRAEKDQTILRHEHWYKKSNPLRLWPPALDPDQQAREMVYTGGKLTGEGGNHKFDNGPGVPHNTWSWGCVHRTFVLAEGRGAAGDAAISCCNFFPALLWMGACLDKSNGGVWSSESSRVTTVGPWVVTEGLIEGEDIQKRLTYVQTHYLTN